MNERKGKRSVTSMLLATLALLLIIAAVAGLPRAYVGYHQWQANRAMNEFVANGQTGASIERADYHLDRMVAVGAFMDVH